MGRGQGFQCRGRHGKETVLSVYRSPWERNRLSAHSEHRFPAPSSLKEGCRKPVLGVWAFSIEVAMGRGHGFQCRGRHGNGTGLSM